VSPRPGPHGTGIATLAAAFVLVGCGGGGGDQSPPANPHTVTLAPSRPIEQSDIQIAQAIYGAGQRTPPDFYNDPAPSGYSFVATSHLKNTDVDPAIIATAAPFELCTDDWNEALAWSESSAANAPQYGNLVETNDDGRFFEFGRVRSGTPRVFQRSRVFKCSYLNRASADLHDSNGAAGQLNRRPLTAAELRLTSEYLWQFTLYNNFGHVVLKSAGTSAAGAIRHTLYIGTLTHSSGPDACDRIDVIAWRHTADATGVLTRTVETLSSFAAREMSGTAQLCSS
jgi:hypothetical protein